MVTDDSQIKQNPTKNRDLDDTTKPRILPTNNLPQCNARGSGNPCTQHDPTTTKRTGNGGLKKMLKVCPICKEQFEPKQNNTKYCYKETCRKEMQRRHSQNYYYRHRDEIIQRHREYEKQPEVRERRTKYQREWRKRPENHHRILEKDRLRRQQRRRYTNKKKTLTPQPATVSPPIFNMDLHFRVSDYMELSMREFCRTYHIHEEAYFHLCHTINKGNWSIL